MENNSQENKAIIIRYIDELNKRNLDVLNEVAASTYIIKDGQIITVE